MKTLLNYYGFLNYQRLFENNNWLTCVTTRARTTSYKARSLNITPLLSLQLIMFKHAYLPFRH